MERLSIIPGMLKMDVENYEMDILLGAEKMIRKYHPVLSVAIYHGTQLIEIPKWVEMIGGYEIRFHTETFIQRLFFIFENFIEDIQSLYIFYF
jgi:hypothetical protein